MLNKITQLFKGKQYGINKNGESYLSALSMLVILMLQKESTEDQTYYFLNILKDYNYKNASLEKLSYTLTDFMAKLDPISSPSWLSIEFEKGLSLHPTRRIALIGRCFILTQLGEESHQECGGFIGAITQSMDISIDLVEQLLSEVEYNYLIYKRGAIEPPYVEPHRILNEALKRTKLSFR